MGGLLSSASADGVVTAAASPGPESLPSASRARTEKVYEDDGLRPVMSIMCFSAGTFWIFLPLRYTSYRRTFSASAALFHMTCTDVDVLV